MRNLEQTKVWKIRAISIIWFLLIVLFLISLPLVLSISTWLFILLVILSLIFASILLLIRKVLKKDLSFSIFSRNTIVSVLILTFLCAFPVLYSAVITQFNPTLIPQITLTNGKKTVIFQGMQHVGSENFYKSVIYDLEDALSRDYVFLYEGIKPGTKESDQWFNSFFGNGKDLAANYKFLGKVCGLEFQNSYFQLLSKGMIQSPAIYVVADVSTLQLKRKYDELLAKDPNFAQAMQQRQHTESSSPNFLSTAIEKISNGNKKQKDITGILCRGIMTLSLNKDRRGKNDEIDKLIVDYRNEVLVDYIINQPNPKIFITYGDAHFSGVYKILEKRDPRWNIVSIKWIRTIDSPVQYKKELGIL